MSWLGSFVCECVCVTVVKVQQPAAALQAIEPLQGIWPSSEGLPSMFCGAGQCERARVMTLNARFGLLQSLRMWTVWKSRTGVGAGTWPSLVPMHVGTLRWNRSGQTPCCQRTSAAIEGKQSLKSLFLWDLWL